METGCLWWTNVLNSALPPQRHRPDTRPEHQDPVIHTAQKKRGKKSRKKERKMKERKKERESRREEGKKQGRKEGKKEERK